ncbi:hypothetical protein [Rhizobium rhizoryzae]|uniref:Uncharacterized protein n=1 Tax=Rhizobium rhizoryzae TaxID=451876 RepID=A0A7W6LKF0_9HYPH|nr:hypothetical protein [Rhizobium rhizoryzae]MBB4145866.1 hypothetical protein [Rhizobium rhizoryzae]
MSEREPTIINTGGSGSAGWAVAVIILLAVIVGGYLLLGGAISGGKSVDVNVKLPSIEAPSK